MSEAEELEEQYTELHIKYYERGGCIVELDKKLDTQRIITEACRQANLALCEAQDRIVAENRRVISDLEAAIRGLRETLKHMGESDEYAALRILVRSDIEALQRIVDSAGPKARG